MKKFFFFFAIAVLLGVGCNRTAGSKQSPATEEAEVDTQTNISFTECFRLQKKFDEYIEKANLPIHQVGSLCYGLNMSSNFLKLEPKWAIGKLTKVNPEFTYTFTFEGLNKSGDVQVPLTEEELKNFQVGEYYKIDMHNKCKHFFMTADSRFPSPLASTFVKPQPVSCVVANL